MQIHITYPQIWTYAEFIAIVDGRLKDVRVSEEKPMVSLPPINRSVSSSVYERLAVGQVSQRVIEDGKQRQAHHRKHTDQPKEQCIQATGMSNLLDNDKFCVDMKVEHASIDAREYHHCYENDAIRTFSFPGSARIRFRMRSDLFLASSSSRDQPAPNP